ncbi:MAG: hypothetical protein AAGA12_02620 [Pseudomonadota bacterium]
MEYENFTAKEIYQDMLDRIGQAYFDDDFDYIRRVIFVPHTFVTFESTYVMETETDLRKMYDNLRVHFRSQNIDTYHRVCHAAEFKSSTLIEGMHVTHMLSDVQQVEDSYPVRSFLKCVDNVWQVFCSDNAITEDGWHSRALKHAKKPNYFEQGANAHLRDLMHPPKQGEETND